MCAKRTNYKDKTRSQAMGGRCWMPRRCTKHVASRCRLLLLHVMVSMLHQRDTPPFMQGKLHGTQAEVIPFASTTPRTEIAWNRWEEYANIYRAEMRYNSSQVSFLTDKRSLHFLRCSYFHKQPFRENNFQHEFLDSLLSPPLPPQLLHFRNHLHPISSHPSCSATLIIPLALPHPSSSSSVSGSLQVGWGFTQPS